MTNLSQQLRIALDRLGPNGENWAHGEDKLNCGRHCAWTAQDSHDAAQFFANVLGLHHHKAVFAWNDAPERTWPEVKAAFEKAIAVAEASERSA